jgi:hypothetical protein
MAVNLGGWGWAVGMAIDFGSPMLGAAFGVPALAGQAGQLLKRALGLAPNVSEETVRNAVESDPETAKAAFAAANTEAAAKWEYLAKVVEAQAEVAKTQISEVNETIRAETAAQAGKPNGWWGHWRTWMAYELTVECPIWGALICWCIVTGKINELVAATGLLTVWWGARFGVLGIHLWSGSNERQAAITGAPVPGAISTAVATVKAVVRPK